MIFSKTWIICDLELKWVENGLKLVLYEAGCKRWRGVYGLLLNQSPYPIPLPQIFTLHHIPVTTRSRPYRQIRKRSDGIGSGPLAKALPVCSAFEGHCRIGF